MDFRQLDRGELVAVLGGAILGVSVFLAWYTLGDKFTVLGSSLEIHALCDECGAKRAKANRTRKQRG